MTRRRWFSYSTRTLLIALTAFAVWLGWWVNGARRLREAVAALEGQDVYVSIEYAYDVVNAKSVFGRSWVPQPILEELGVDFFHNVVVVNADCLSDPRIAEDMLAAIARLKHLEDLTLSNCPTVSEEALGHLAQLRGCADSRSRALDSRR